MRPYDTGDFAGQADVRIVPSGWIERSAGAASQPPHPDERPRKKWLTTLSSPLAIVREAALNALSAPDTRLGRLEEIEGKVVIHATRIDCQIRAELTAIDPQTTRVGVGAMRGDHADWRVSDEIVTAIERRLERSAALP